MDDQKGLSNSPLSLNDLQIIEKTGLSTLERHHLRLLAHCLASFKNMAAQSQNTDTSLPNQESQLKWCAKQPSIGNDNSFIEVLLEQFSAAAVQLENLATRLGISPLELTLDDLINETVNSKRT